MSANILVLRAGEAAGRARSLYPEAPIQARLVLVLLMNLAAVAASLRVAAVWSSTMLRARQTADIVADRLGLDVVPDDRLRELINDERWTPPLRQEDEPGDVYAAWLEGDLDGTIFGETGHDVVGRLKSVVEEVADRFRGEAVLLVSHGGIIELGLTHLARNVNATFVDSHPLDNGEAVEVEVDSSGWVCTTWAGEPMGARLQA